MSRASYHIMSQHHKCFRVYLCLREKRPTWTYRGAWPNLSMPYSSTLYYWHTCCVHNCCVVVQQYRTWFDKNIRQKTERKNCCVCFFCGCSVTRCVTKSKKTKRRKNNCCVCVYVCVLSAGRSVGRRDRPSWPCHILSHTLYCAVWRTLSGVGGRISRKRTRGGAVRVSTGESLIFLVCFVAGAVLIAYGSKCTEDWPPCYNKQYCTFVLSVNLAYTWFCLPLFRVWSAQSMCVWL